MILSLKTRILQSMAANEENSTITRNVKAAIRDDLNSRYTNPPDIQDYLHRSTALDPRFKPLTYLEPALRERTYSDLTIEIVAAEEGQATEPTSTRADTEPEASPPQKKSAMEELFGDTFVKESDTEKTFANIKEEVASYRVASSMPMDGGDPLAWWKSNDYKYPHIAKMARRYLAVPATSVPSERVFSTAEDSDYQKVYSLHRKCRHPNLFEKEFDILSTGLFSGFQVVRSQVVFIFIK